MAKDGRTYITELLCIYFGLSNLWSTGHRAVLQLVYALPVVYLIKKIYIFSKGRNGQRPENERLNG